MEEFIDTRGLCLTSEINTKFIPEHTPVYVAPIRAKSMDFRHRLGFIDCTGLGISRTGSGYMERLVV